MSEPHARVALYGVIRSQIVFCVLFVPEFEGRTLEELDLLYDAGIPARNFATYDITKLKSAPMPASGGKAVSVFEDDANGKKERLEA
jgi:hypothetical protein